MRRRVRRKPVVASLPPSARSYLVEHVSLYARVPQSDRDELLRAVSILLARKRFEGAGGLRVTEEMRLAIASQAAVLLLHRRTRFYPKLASIIVYPEEYAVREELEAEDGLVDELFEGRAGESWQTGAVILSWKDVERDLSSRGENVVLHEFAHQLDAETGSLNGAPVLKDAALRRRWPATLAAAFERLIDAVDCGRGSVLDPYGTEDPAEFFAVATEAFFLRPRALQRTEPTLYDVLAAFYRQDPARWQ